MHSIECKSQLAARRELRNRETRVKTRLCYGTWANTYYKERRTKLWNSRKVIRSLISRHGF